MTIRGRQNLAVVAALVCALVVTTVQAQQVPIPTTAAQVPGPASGTAMTKAYVQMVGRMAYLWGWTLVNSHNRRAGFAYLTSQNGNVPGWNGGVVPMAPIGQLCMLNDYIKPEQTFVACPNQDVVYGADSSPWTRTRLFFKYRTLATVSGCMRCMTHARTSSQRLASPTARSPAST